MKNFIILIIFSFSVSLYAGSDLFPFGMNHTVYEEHHSLTEDTEYKTKYKASMDWTAAAGIKWWRAQYAFRWCDVQPIDLNNWNFETEDSLVKWAGERNLHLLPSIGYTADSARHPGTNSLSWENRRRYPPDTLHWDDYKKYIDTLVKRYKRDIKYWQFSNEPYGSYFLGSPGQYVEMYESTRVALKEADPTAKIVGLCMTSTTGTFEWTYFNPDPLIDSIVTIEYDTWEEAIVELIDSIGLEYIDVVSHHIYNNTSNFMHYIRDLRNIVGEDKPIWITETGFQNADPMRAERGRNENCEPTRYVTYSSDSGEVFWDSVLVNWAWTKPCIRRIDTFLNIGDTVILFSRSDNDKDTIIYNGSNLIYKSTDTALALDDTLTIFDFWAEEITHRPSRQDTSYDERLDSIINTPDFLNNLKIFFFCADNTIHKKYYPPIIRFGNKLDDPTTYIPTGYYRQRLHSVYSVIDTMDNPYPAYWTIRDKILSPRTPVIQDTTIEIDGIKTYQAESGITVSDFTIKGNGSYGGKVAMEAGFQIYLLDGFRVEEGGSFYATTNLLYQQGGGGLSSIKSIAIPKKAKTSEKSVSDKENIPKVFSCAQNFPNPFAGNTTIKYGLPKDIDVKLEIFNLAGQKVHTLVDGRQTAGYKQIRWNGTNGSGVKLPQGVYFYVLKAGNEFEDKYKMIVLK